MKRLAIHFAAAAVAILTSAAAYAAADVVIQADQAKMLAIAGKPKMVVVGNPNIADVTVQGSALFVHGRNFGSTNVLVYDSDGNEMAAIEVTVAKGGSHNISVFKAAQGFTYSCTPVCESTPQVGDNYSWFKDMVEANKTKGELAASSEKTSDQP